MEGVAGLAHKGFVPGWVPEHLADLAPAPAAAHTPAALAERGEVLRQHVLEPVDLDVLGRVLDPRRLEAVGARLFPRPVVLRFPVSGRSVE